MMQIAVPDGFELIYFSWNRVGSVLDADARHTQMESGASRTRFACTATRAAERLSTEEDVERWDGLS
jgi:hypothetical protein